MSERTTCPVTISAPSYYSGWVTFIKEYLDTRITEAIEPFICRSLPDDESLLEELRLTIISTLRQAKLEGVISSWQVGEVAVTDTLKGENLDAVVEISCSVCPFSSPIMLVMTVLIKQANKKEKDRHLVAWGSEGHKRKLNLSMKGK